MPPTLKFFIDYAHAARDLVYPAPPLLFSLARVYRGAWGRGYAGDSPQLGTTQMLSSEYPRLGLPTT